MDPIREIRVIVVLTLIVFLSIMILTTIFDSTKTASEKGIVVIKSLLALAVIAGIAIFFY